MKSIFLIRHCKAEGQEPLARLTAEGERQAHELALFLKKYAIDYIATSPFVRAVGTIEPFCNAVNLTYTVDDRLSERVLSSENMPNWMDALRMTYENMELAYEGGESSRQAMDRGMEVINELLDGPVQNVLVVTHGVLLSLILKYFDSSIGYKEWQGFTNPDVYVIKQQEGNRGYRLERIWR